jgi:ParB family chromosome partitioning protein
MSRSSSSSLILGIIEDIDIYRIKHPPHFYRPALLGINDLASSIKARGLLQPIIVRTKEEHYFEIVAGNRRYLACKTLGWRKIICHIAELDDKEAFEVSLIENIQRKTLSPIDEAHAFRSYVKEFGWGGISDLAERIGKSVSYVDKRLKLLNLPLKIIERVSNLTINTSIAEELISLEDKNEQIELANLVQTKRLSSRKVRELVKEYKESVYDFNSTNQLFKDRIEDIDEKVQRSFDKSIITLKIAMNKLGRIIEDIEENWIIYEILMQHKNTLNAQIDLLIKEKKKLR